MQAYITLKKNIRDYLSQLLAQTASPIVEAADAQAFVHDNSDECCTIDNFQIDLSGPPKSEWNCSASQVFARAYCDFYHVPAQMQQKVLVDVAERFLTRVKALKSKYQTKAKSDFEQSGILQVRRRRTRKTTVRFNHPSITKF